MSYGLYLSASGALTNMHRQNVFANNLANLRTVGFKPDAVDIRQRPPERVERPDVRADPKWMLERLGGGVFAEPTRVTLGQGDLVQSGNDLDLAISGEGFFVVNDGKSVGPAGRLLTRDGRFTLNDRGDLVMAAGGMRVLDRNQKPIRVDPTRPVRIDGNGLITQDGSEVAQIQVVGAPAPDQLHKAGRGTLRTIDPLTAPPAFAGQVRQRFTEESAVDPILMMNAMISAAKSAQANLKLMQYHDQLLGKAFNTFGRVA